MPTKKQRITNEWERELINNFCTSKASDSVQSDSENEDCSVQLPGNELSHSEVLKKLPQIRNFANEKESDMSERFQELIHMTEVKIFRARCIKRQTILDSFLILICFSMFSHAFYSLENMCYLFDMKCIGKNAHVEFVVFFTHQKFI